MTTHPHLLPQRVIKLPAWLPPARRRDLAGRRIALSVPSGVRARLRVPERIPPSEWNEKYRVMPASESFPGKWRRDIAPHAAWIMDLYAAPWVRELWFCGIDQASKTSSMLGCLAAVAIDMDPGNIFYTASNEDKTKEIVNDKLIGMIRESPRLRKRLSKRSDDTGMSKIRMNNGVTIRAAWSNSPASTASFSARYTFNDEVDKWIRVGKETSPIRRIRKRTKNYPLTYKHFWSSTPAGQYIYQGMLACQQIWTHAARCPDCLTLVVMDEDHLHIPAEATEESIKADPEAIRYACNACGSLWDEQQRLHAYRTGDKLCLKGADILQPVDIGVHITGFVTPDMPLADIARTVLLARSGDLDAKIDLAHGIKAIDYEPEQIVTVGLENLVHRTEEYGPHIPADACLLTAGADIQQDRIEVEIVAWGTGSQSWGIMYTVLWGDTRLPEVWDQLDRHLLQTFNHAHGATLGISRAFIDAGYLPQQVYRFTGPRRARGIYAIEGSETVDAPEVAGPTNRHRAGMAIPVYRLGVNRIKSALFGSLGLETVGPGYCHLPVTSDQGPGTSNGLSRSPVPGPCFRYPANWFDMIQAEHAVPVDKGQSLVRWEKRKGGLRNEAIDCRVYAMSALLSMRVDLKGMLAELQTHTDPQPEESRTRPTKQRRW